jgi:putative tryptophan/tyrosine transport system substrate-binding protein
MTVVFGEASLAWREQMRRRDFTLLVGGAIAWPFAARAQTTARHIGLLMPMAEKDPEGDECSAEFERGLTEHGWTGGHNVRIDYRWDNDNPDKINAAISEFQALSPDVIVASTSRSVAALRQAMPTTPIVFVMIYEPVAQGFVQSLAHPNGNATGFTGLPATVGGKWLELLMEIAPTLARVAYLCNPDSLGVLQPYSAVEAAVRQHRVTVKLAGIRGDKDIEAAMATLAQEPGGGLIVPPDGFLTHYRQLIVDLAARDRLPAIYGQASYAERGGLVSYGVKMPEQYRAASAYVDRLLRGAKPGELAVQQPTQYNLTINIKAARTMGLDIPPTLLAAADEVIE